MKQALNEEEVRTNFEIGLLFHVNEMFPGRTNKEHLKRESINPNALYVNEHIECAWRGYLMAARALHAQLDRYAEDRYLGVGTLNQIRDATVLQSCAFHMTEATVREVLKIIGGTPA